MPRIERKISKMKLYHVMSRALNKQLLFFDETDYLKYLEMVSDLKDEFDIEIISYCLMSNHTHLLIYDKKNNLSKFIGKLNSRYAMYYNKKNFRVGYVFSGRFKSECIESEEYFLECIRYIHQNPVRAKICANTYDYKFSSIHAYRSKKGNYLDIVNVDKIYKLISKNKFLTWNEEVNNDKFIEVVNNKLIDEEVLSILYKYAKVKTQKEYNALDEAVKMHGILKMIDNGGKIRQLSRVSGISYSKIQRLKRGEEGKVVNLTYFPK